MEKVLSGITIIEGDEETKKLFAMLKGENDDLRRRVKRLEEDRRRLESKVRHEHRINREYRADRIKVLRSNLNQEEMRIRAIGWTMIASGISAGGLLAAVIMLITMWTR